VRQPSLCFRRIEPVPQRSLARSFGTLGSLWPGALPAMNATAPVRHSGLLTGTAVVLSTSAAPAGRPSHCYPVIERRGMRCRGHFCAFPPWCVVLSSRRERTRRRYATTPFAISLSGPMSPSFKALVPIGVGRAYAGDFVCLDLARDPAEYASCHQRNSPARSQ